MPSVDSGGSLAAKRYARAVMEIAVAQGTTETWTRALDQIAEFMNDPEVKRVLENTRVDQELKQRLIMAALSDQPGLALNLARLLVRKGRTNLAADIAGQFKQMVEQQTGVARAHATTAVALSDSERDHLAARLQEQTGHRILLETDVDPELLGGVVVQIGDRLVDASTRARLESLRETLTGAV